MNFEQYHPAINLLYFTVVLICTVCFSQPVFQILSWLCAFAYSTKRNGVRSLILNLCLIPLVILFALYYSAYHHFGVTVLRQNFIGNSMTLESLTYGLRLGMMVASIIMWGSCLLSVFTTDKIVYLFGRVSPKASLFLSIFLRMAPRMKGQARRIRAARKSIGYGVNQGNILAQLRNRIKIFSMLLTWLLESFTSISDSMRSRGYGLKGRTAFSIYRFDNRDRSFVVGLFACMTLVLMAHLLNQTTMVFDPKLILNPITPASIVFYVGYGTLCLLPMALELIGAWMFAHKRTQL